MLRNTPDVAFVRLWIIPHEHHATIRIPKLSFGKQRCSHDTRARDCHRSASHVQRALKFQSPEYDRVHTFPVGALPQQCQPWSDAERQPEIDFLLPVLGVVFVPRFLIGLASLGLTTVAGFIKRHRSSDVPYQSAPNGTPIVRLAQARGLRRWRSNKNVAAAEVRARADVAITMTSAVLLEAGRRLDEARNIQNSETISVMLDDLDADSRQRSE